MNSDTEDDFFRIATLKDLGCLKDGTKIRVFAKITAIDTENELGLLEFEGIKIPVSMNLLSKSPAIDETYQWGCAVKRKPHDGLDWFFNLSTIPAPDLYLLAIFATKVIEVDLDMYMVVHDAKSRFLQYQLAKLGSE